MPNVVRQDIFLVATDALSAGFLVLRKDNPKETNPYLDQLIITNDPSFSHNDTRMLYDPLLYESVEDGDIGYIGIKGNLRVLLSRRANHNTVLITERCDNRCLFCSQPPKDTDDDWLLIQSAMAIAAFGSTETIGVSGGEPLLYRDSFLRFLDFLAEHSPKTPLHVLSNGRAFSDPQFTREVAKRCNTLSVVFGIPLYAASSELHDHLVGAPGAFRETMLGLINAGNSGIPAELRIIPTKTNHDQLGAITELASRCVSGVTQISIMNLEPTGWAKKNWGTLYTDPSTYHADLEIAVAYAKRGDIPVYLFNYPRCHLPAHLRPYAVQSISDWKNYYPDECISCVEKLCCSGYFSSSKGKVHSPPRSIQ